MKTRCLQQQAFLQLEGGLLLELFFEQGASAAGAAAGGAAVADGARADAALAQGLAGDVAHVEGAAVLARDGQRPRLAAGLRALGLQVIEGSANYLLFRAPETLGAALQQRGVCLRSCGNYPGLSAGWYRTAVRTAPENEQLLQTRLPTS